MLANVGLTYDQAADRLKVGYPHVMFLLRTGRLDAAEDGGVTPESVQAFQDAYRPPSGYISSIEAGERLGISRNHVPLLVEAGLVRGDILPNPLGGAWIFEPDLDGLDMKKVAELGIKVPAPEGYLSGGDARRRLSINRSSLRYLVKNGSIRCLDWSPMNTFYLQEDVERVASSR